MLKFDTRESNDKITVSRNNINPHRFPCHMVFIVCNSFSIFFDLSEVNIIWLTRYLQFKTATVVLCKIKHMLKLLYADVQNIHSHLHEHQ